MSIGQLVLAILTWFGPHSWSECGHQYTPKEMENRAEYYARLIKHEATTHPGAPEAEKWMLAIGFGESGLDSCQVGDWFRKKKKLGRRPTKEMVIKALHEYKGGKVDSGVVQWLWPPYKGFVTAAQAITPEYGFKKLARSLPKHYQKCKHQYPLGIRSRGKRGKTVVYLACKDMYWTFHNTGGKGFSLKYYRNINYQLWKMLGGQAS